MSLLFGFDIGGTKIELVALNALSTNQVLFRQRVPTNRDRGYESILDTIHGLFKDGCNAVGYTPKLVGFGTPGTLESSSNLLRGSNTVCLNGKPFALDLAKKLGVEVVLDNDANCFALAEATLGAGRGYDSVFGVILGTGVGAGVIIDQRVIRGKQGIAGEWGHNAVDLGLDRIKGSELQYVRPSSVDCYCGKTHCVEATISGPALAKYYTSQSSSPEENVSLAEVYARYKNGDPIAKMTIARLVRCFGEGISSVINIIDPHAIVLGGGVSNIDELYTEGVSWAKKFVFNPKPEVTILKNQLGDSAGVLGAAMLTKALAT